MQTIVFSLAMPQSESCQPEAAGVLKGSPPQITPQDPRRQVERWPNLNSQRDAPMERRDFTPLTKSLLVIGLLLFLLLTG